MSWAGHRPAPLSTSERVTLDTLGRSRQMTIRRWAWLIGMTDETDRRLLHPGQELRHTAVDSSSAERRLDFDGYAPERRAIRLAASDREVPITIKPETPWVNPVFEFTRTAARRCAGHAGGPTARGGPLRVGWPNALARCHDRDAGRSAPHISRTIEFVSTGAMAVRENQNMPPAESNADAK